MAEHPAVVPTTNLECSSVDDAHTHLMRLTQGGIKPAYLRIWRRRGVRYLLAHNQGVERPYRRGELALITSTPHSCAGAGVWDLKYGDGRCTQLEIMDYVWEIVTLERVRVQYVEKSEDD
jgi:hypothetical protein